MTYLPKDTVRQLKAAQHSLTGRQSKAAGRQFEARLDAAFEYYRAQGLAAIEKTPEPMHPVRNLGGGQFVAYFEKKAQADYSGVLRGGRAVVLEAKYTSAHRIEQSRVTYEQSRFLEERQALGAWCYVLLGFRTGNVYRLPWVLWRDMKDSFGRRHVTEEDISELRVPAQGLIPLVLSGI